MPLYPCRGVIDGSVEVGRVRADFGGCHVGFAGHEIEVTPYSILTTSWRPGTDGLPLDSLYVGQESLAAPGKGLELARLYLCRTTYEGDVESGQARGGERGCSFGYKGSEVSAQTYEVLQAAPWLTWVSALPGNLPESALVSGNEGGEPLLACRAADLSGLHPGKITRKSLGCSIASNGREAVIERFEVLVPKWSAAGAGTVPVSSFIAGWEAGSQFICRAQSSGSKQIGRLSEALGGCHVGMQGGEVVLTDYEVLIQ